MQVPVEVLQTPLFRQPQSESAGGEEGELSSSPISDLRVQCSLEESVSSEV